MANSTINSSEAASPKLRHVAKGSATFMLGRAASLILQFVSGVILVRTLTVGQYGEFSLANNSVALIALISLLGFQTGLPRFIVASADNRAHDLGVAVGTPLVITALLSSFVACLLWLGSSWVADIFLKPNLGAAFELLAWSIPPMAIMKTLNPIFRGLKNKYAQIIFDDIASVAIRLPFLLMCFLYSSEFETVVTVYVVAAWIVLVLYLYYFLKYGITDIKLSFKWAFAWELIQFSWPLLGVALLSNLMVWIVSMVLGFSHESRELGLFNAPQRLTNFVPLPLLAVSFMYLPMASSLIRDDQRGEFTALYRSVTKWAWWITLPFLLYMVIDARFLVSTIFGEDYLPAAHVLSILAIGFGISNFLGPNNLSLVALGASRSVLHGSVLAVIVVTAGSIFLAPKYGAVGAAMAVAMAVSSSNLYASAILHWRYGIHPFGARYLISVCSAVAGGIIFSWAFRALGIHGFSFSILHVLATSLATILFVIVSGALDGSDKAILVSVLQKFTGTTVARR